MGRYLIGDEFKVIIFLGGVQSYFFAEEIEEVGPALEFIDEISII
jgi:hypothetical protein